MLTDKIISAAKPGERPYKLADRDSLSLLVNPNGRKLWRFRYRFEGREKMISVGTYPETTLKMARERTEDSRRLLAKGVDPSGRRRTQRDAQEITFEMVAVEWLGLQKKTLAPNTYTKAVWTLETLVFPLLGKRPITGIVASDVLRVLKRIELRGLHETAHRTRQRVSQVFRYAIVTDRATHDPTAALRGALAPVVTKNRAAITDPVRVGELLRTIDSYRGHVVTWYALRLAPMVFVRPGELIRAEWVELDIEGSEPVWRIPGEKMKMREAHVVPLSRQAVALLKELRGLTGEGRYLFPALTSSKRCMSNNTLNLAFRRMGYSKEEMTAHGIRTTASTNLNEQGWHPDLIELQLAHNERNAVRGAYNRAQRLGERRKMMQSWSDYLDRLRSDDPSAKSKLEAA